MAKKVLALFLSMVMLVSVLTVPALADEREITVIYNGENLEFDVPPMLINSRTMVPMRAIFEALGATVYWNDYNETVVGVSSHGDRVVIPIGSTTASINDLPYEIDSPATLVNDRTLVPLRFVSEALECDVEWDDATYTVNIVSGNEGNEMLYFDNTSYSTLGTWTDVGSHIIRAKIDGIPAESPRDDAVANFSVGTTGTYKLWAKAIDYANDQQGSRFFNIDVNGKRLDKTFGQHGKDEFHWEDGGTIELTRGEVNEIRICDTAGFFGRLQGLIITNDLEFVPEGGYEDYQQYVLANLKAGSQIPASFPEWANQKVSEVPAETIENDTYKINFYKGTTARGDVVQNEIFIKRDGEWTLVKDRSEDLGILALHADDSIVATDIPPRFSVDSLPFEAFNMTFDTFEGQHTATSIKQYYKTGKPEWLIPKSITKVDDKTVKLEVSSEKVEGTMTFILDDLADDPKVTFNAKLKNDGAYSFTYFSGNDFSDKSFEKVTAPLHFTQKEIPVDASVIGESSMFTPMVAFTFVEDGKTLTKGVAVDPTSVRQYVARPGDQDFGVLFRSPDGNARGQIVAPLFGTNQCLFKAGDDYTFSYRILYNDLDGYNTMKHVAQDLFNCVDLRENYYTSLNEAIYNTTDLIKDDLYSGWHEDEKAFIYMESDTKTREVDHTNVLELIQRYLLTEDEEFLDERVIPSLAYTLSRGSVWYDSSRENPKRLGGTTNYSASTYIGMYQATQGRMPFLYSDSFNKYKGLKDSHGTMNAQAMNFITNSDEYTNDLIENADKNLEKLYSEDFAANASFIQETTIKMLNVLVRAYEETNEQKYLDGAKLVGEYIMQQIWTTGYQNDYATTEYTVDPEYISN
ncbi:MAG: copper amine oxidase N-terminal domain-containing protein, partial [Clostridia bacterium]|nr:copper amine oxidase N-terminal domain-containing protein [Clostridia bacterium]